jgi:hypothetical protein
MCVGTLANLGGIVHPNVTLAFQLPILFVRNLQDTLIDVFVVLA